MDLNTYLNTKETLIGFSNRTGIPCSSLSFWRYNKRPIPVKWMSVIEKETGGLVSRKEMRPNDWQSIWPELAEQEKSREVA